MDTRNIHGASQQTVDGPRGGPRQRRDAGLGGRRLRLERELGGARTSRQPRLGRQGSHLRRPACIAGDGALPEGGMPGGFPCHVCQGQPARLQAVPASHGIHRLHFLRAPRHQDRRDHRRGVMRLTSLGAPRSSNASIRFSPPQPPARQATPHMVCSTPRPGFRQENVPER